MNGTLFWVRVFSPLMLRRWKFVKGLLVGGACKLGEEAKGGGESSSPMGAFCGASPCGLGVLVVVLAAVAILLEPPVSRPVPLTCFLASAAASARTFSLKKRSRKARHSLQRLHLWW